MSDDETATTPGRGGRRGRSARRSARLSDHGPDWLPELDRGLPYLDLLSEEQMARVHDETMRLLEEVGCEFRDDEAVEMWRVAGADIDGQRVRFDRDFLMGLISSAPEHYTICLLYTSPSPRD